MKHVVVLLVLLCVAGCVEPEGSTGFADVLPGPILHVSFTSASETLPREITWELADPDGAKMRESTWKVEPGDTRRAAAELDRAGLYRLVVSDRDFGGKEEFRVDQQECGGRNVVLDLIIRAGAPTYESRRDCP